MNTLRLSTLSLSLAVAVVTLGFTTPSLAVKPVCPGDHPSCKDDPITYTVDLMGRVFHFDPPPKNFTPNEKENALFPNPAMPLTFARPGSNIFPCPVDSFSEACEAWDAVFASCENFFGPNPIPPIGSTPIVVSGFTVPAGNWRINKAGGVRLVMFDIPFDVQGNSTNLEGAYFTVTLQLIGNDLFDDPNAVWLPDSNSDEAKEYPMISSWITGGTVKGVHPRKSCVSKGGTEIIMDFDSGSVHTLKIVAN